MKWIGAALVWHFFVVVLGAASIDVTRWGVLGAAVEAYGDVTGAYSGFGFFTPGVSEDLRARFLVEGGEGPAKVEELFPSHSNEANVRVGNILTQFWDKVENVNLRRALTASWAAQVFERHPEASHVTVLIESFRPVSMEEYRNGQRGQWKLFYRARYQR